MAFFLGIDAGASKTRCALGDEERVLATALSSSCKIQRVGEAEARRVLHAVVQQACQTARVPPNEIKHICMGISGASEPNAVESIRRILNELVPAPADVIGDV